MLSFPNAKINIGLQVTSKRPDKFHNIESILYPIKFSDALEAVLYPFMRFQTGGIDLKDQPESNLCFKAWKLLNDRYGINTVDMYLYKNIPAGSGLGGGSSDASFTLKILNELFQLELSNSELKHLAANLGSDCPFFIDNSPAIIKGRGDVIQNTDLSLEGYFIKLVIPEIQISTAEAYQGIQPQKAAYPIESICNTPLNQWKDFVLNDFEKAIFNKYPELENIKKKLYHSGAIYASMSGSGSAFYGIYKSLPQKKMFNGMFEWEGVL